MISGSNRFADAESRSRFLTLASWWMGGPVSGLLGIANKVNKITAKVSIMSKKMIHAQRRIITGKKGDRFIERRSPQHFTETNYGDTALRILNILPLSADLPCTLREITIPNLLVHSCHHATVHVTQVAKGPTYHILVSRLALAACNYRIVRSNRKQARCRKFKPYNMLAITAVHS